MAKKSKVDKSYQKQLPKLKKDIERAVTYWKPNAERFHKFQKFAFKTAITPTDASALNTAQKPILEFNIVNAPISRYCGEFSKQEPSIEVMAEFGSPIDPQIIEVVDGHIRHIFSEAKKHNTQYMAYRNSLSGGFFSFKVWTEYAHEKSFDQVIRFGLTHEATMTGYDPMAREPDKSDAEFCFEIFPMDKEQFKQQYPWVEVETLEFLKSENSFNWSYKNQQQYIVVVVDMYCKQRENKTIVKLADGQVMPKEDYEQFILHWKKQGFAAQPPVVTDERETELISICRYRFMESEILEREEMSSRFQPLVFGDGDSIVLQEDSSAALEQFTKPYIYHAEGIQRLTNFAGQMIANDFETMVMHKFMIAEEALPTQPDALNAWTNAQQAAVLVHKAFYDNDPDKALPPPQTVQRVGLPAEVITTFNNSMNMLQAILGSYDASLATGDNEVSGKAIVESATLSNAAAMPYVVNYMQALSRVANIIVDWMPKYYKTPRTIPIIDKEGKRDYVKINQKGGIDINYDSNLLQVRVEAGVNFSIAKNQALQQLTLLMKVSPEFAEFMNEVGLETLLENIEFRNVDILKSKVQQWQQMKAKKKAEQPDPAVIQAQAQQQQAQTAQALVQNEFKKTELKAEEVQGKAAIDAEKIVNERKKLDNDRLKLMMEAGESQANITVAIKKAEAEEARADADVEIKHAEMHLKAHDMGHGHAMDVVGHHHEVKKSEQEKKEVKHEERSKKSRSKKT